MTCRWPRRTSIEPSVAQIVEHMPGKEVDSLGRSDRSLKLDAEPDVPDLDDSMFGNDPEIAGDPDWPIRRLVDDGIENVGRRF